MWLAQNETMSRERRSFEKLKFQKFYVAGLKFWQRKAIKNHNPPKYQRIMSAPGVVSNHVKAAPLGA
jgi:hypothetical protein